MLWIINRDVFINGGLAEAHEKTKTKEYCNKWPKPHGGGEGDKAVAAMDSVICGRIGKHEQQHKAEAEAPVEHSARAEFV